MRHRKLDNGQKMALIIGGVALVGMIGFNMLSKSGKDKYEVPDGYVSIDDVPGASFYIDNRFMDIATAITQLTPESDLDGKTFYSYRNGEDRFILFNMSKFAVLAQKGTDFGLDQGKENIPNANICNVFFTPDEKEDIEQIDDLTYETVANAQITLTKGLYGDFTGKLVSTKDEAGNEWSIFVGIPGTEYKEIGSGDKDIITAIAESLHVNPIADGKVMVASLDTEELNKEETEVKAKIETPAVQNEETSASKESVPVAVIETNETDSSETAETETAEEATQEGETDTVTIEEAKEEAEEPSKETTADDAVKAPVKEEPKAETKKPEAVTSATPSSTGLISFGKTRQKQVGEVKASSVYAPLDIGDTGTLWVYKDRPGTAEQKISVTKVVRGKEAEDLIRDAIEGRYKFITPQKTCTYEAVEYDLPEGVSSYINIKILGMDGRTLKYKGIKYSKRTHQIITDDGKKCICYYEVPNGCKEYILECGDGTVENDIDSAYYRVMRA